MNRITKILAVAVIIGWSMQSATAQGRLDRINATLDRLEAQERAEREAQEAARSRSSTSGSSPASPASSSSSTSSASSTPASSSSSTANASPAARTTASSSAQQPTKEETIKWLEERYEIYGNLGSNEYTSKWSIKNCIFIREDSDGDVFRWEIVSFSHYKRGATDSWIAFDKNGIFLYGSQLKPSTSAEMVERLTNAFKHLATLCAAEKQPF